MKKKWSLLLMVCALMFAMVFAVVPTKVSAQVVYDDFNGNSIDTTLWTINDPCHILSQSGGFLRAGGPPYHCYGHIWTTKTFGGDFEFVLEYSGFQSDATEFIENPPGISIQVTSSSPPGDDFIYISRHSYTEHLFYSNGKVNGEWRTGIIAVALFPSGLLKISRIGSTITTYYNEGTDWVLLGSFEGAFTGDVTLSISAYSGDNGTFNVSCDKVYAPAAADIEFNLTISKQGTGNGRVTSDPIGVDCGGTCTAAYDIYTSVSLSAIPDAYSTFVGWSGACSGTGSCTVTMDTSKIVTANFVPKAAVYDDFNGDSIDTTLWGIGDPCHIFSQSGGFLRASGPPNHCYGYLWPIQPFVFGGDFEFVLEFSGFQSTATVFSENGPGISLQVTSGGDFIYISRNYVAEHHFTSMGFVNGAWRTGGGAVALFPSGLLKISRIGSTITTYYNEGMDWVPLGSFEGAFTGDVTLTIMVYSGDDGTFNVSCDKVYAPAAEGGKISGRVTDASGNGIANVDVHAYELNHSGGAGVRTDDTGHYSIQLPSGDYKVGFNEPQDVGNYSAKWYDNKNIFHFEWAIIVTVNPGETVTNIDAILELRGTISGKVTDKSGIGIKDVAIIVCDYGYSMGEFARTGSDGEYVVKVPPGAYKIGFNPPESSSFYPQWYSNKTSFDEADFILIESDQLRENVNAQMEIGGKVKGKVTDEFGNPVTNVPITAQDERGRRFESPTLNDGSFSFNLPVGSYKIHFEPPVSSGLYAPQWFNNKINPNEADPVNVEAQTTSEINVQLEVGGRISGRVTDTSGHGIPDVGIMITNPDNIMLSYIWVDWNGYYAANVPVGDWKIAYFPQQGEGRGYYLNGWYSGKAHFQEADVISVAQEETKEVNIIPGIGGKVVGRVTDSAGKGIFNVNVNAIDPESKDIINGAWTDPNGIYAFNVPEGNWKIYFDPWNTKESYSAEWFNDKKDFPSADFVSVIKSQTRENINAQLEAGSAISGRVKDALGNGIPNADITAFDTNNNRINGTRTDINGNYTINLPPGMYKIFSDPWQTGGCYVSKWYDNKYMFNEADSVAVTPGQTALNVDFHLSSDTKITGWVTDAMGSRVAGVHVTAYDLGSAWINHIQTKSDGYYELCLPPGTYKVFFDPRPMGGDYSVQWYSNKSNFSEADPVPVIPGVPTTGINAKLETAYRISGQVTDLSGNPIANADVTAFDLNNQGVSSSRTDSNGNFLLSLPQGTYKILCDPWQTGRYYAAQWYNNKSNFSEADPVPVGPGLPIPGISFQLSSGDKITGWVTNSERNGVAGVHVTAYHLNYQWINHIQTGPDGSYTLSVQPGTYKIYFDPNPIGQNYAEEWYNDKKSFNFANLVTVSPGQVKSDINAQLELKGAISGSVTDGSGNGIPNVDVNVFDPNFGAINGTRTGNAGNYSISLPPGDYKIFFNTQNVGGFYLSEWYQNIYNAHAINLAEVVTVRPGETTQNINIRLETGGKVTGEVLDSNGNRIQSININFYDSSGACVFAKRTESKGIFDLNLLEGTYRLVFEDVRPNGYYLPKMAEVIIINGRTTNQNITLTDIGGRISGRIVDSTGNGLPASIDVFDLNCQHATVGGSTGTDGYGNYSVLVPQGTWRIHFETFQAGEYVLPEWYDNKRYCNEGNIVEVVAGQTITLPDVQLDNGERIMGRVTDGSGNGISGVHVTAYDLNYRWVNHTPTDGNGNYVLGVPTGIYKIFFDPNPIGDTYAQEWFNNKRDFNSADPVTVISGVVLENINAQLELSGMISGRVTDFSGNGIGNIPVNVYDFNFNFVNSAGTDGSGYYSVKVSAGTWKVAFWASQTLEWYADEWYNNKKTFDTADGVTVYEGQTTPGINAQLEMAGKISGRVTDSSGNGVENIPVNVYDFNFQFINGTWIDTGSSGYYSVKVPAGTWKVAFFATQSTGFYLDEWYNNKKTFDTADGVTVVAGQITSNIDAQLETGGKISGRVTDAANPTVGIANVDVWAQDLSGNWMGGGPTDSNGNYSFTVAAGTYKVGFDPWQVAGNYAIKWFDNKTNSKDATPLTVVAGGTTSNINAQLEAGGFISGKVTDKFGNPIKGISVNASTKSNTWVNGTQTDADGNYTMLLPAGDYKVNFGPPWDIGNYAGELYDNTNNFNLAKVVSVVSGQTFPNVNAQLRPVPRLASFDLAVYNGSLSLSFQLQPGLRELLESATLTGPNGFHYDLNLETDVLNWLSECRYVLLWFHTFASAFDYGEYTLTLNFYDGPTETYARILGQSTVFQVNPDTISVTVNPDGSADVSWVLPAGNAGKYYQVRVRSDDGGTEYFSSNQIPGKQVLIDQDHLNIPASYLRCLEPNQTYRWLVRVHDADPSIANWGVSIYDAADTRYKSLAYNPALSGQRISSFTAMSWNGKLGIGFDVRPGSRDDISSAIVTGPNNFSYTFDLEKDFIDISTPARVNKTWWKEFGASEFGNYSLQVVFSDGHTDNVTKYLQEAPVVKVDSSGMNSTIHKNGVGSFQWNLPQGATNQTYEVRIRSLDGREEYYSSARLNNKNTVDANFGELRGLEHAKTYQWFVRAYDPGNNTMQQSNSQTFFYNPFNLDYRSLTVTKVGNGKVTSSLMGINCGPYCQDTFVKGVPVTLTATPDPGSTFIGWGGDCSGTDPCTVTMDAGHTVTATFDVNTPSGGPDGGIIVRPVDPVSSTTPVEITFDSVTTAGSTYLNISQNGEPPPIGFKLGEPPTYYNITTTAVYSGSIQICTNYSGVSFGDESNIRLFHLEGGVWVDRTVSIDTTNKIICANVTSLSPFAIFERVDIIPPVTTAQLSPAPNAAGWNNSDTQVTLSAVDNNGGLGVKNITYSASGAQSIPTTTVSGNSTIFSITAEGQTTITFFAADNANNVETAKNVTLNIDKTKPNVNITATPSTLWPPNHTMVKVTVNGSASDQLSGIAATSFKVTDEYGKVEPTISKFGDVIQLEAWRNGDDANGRIYTISVIATDKAGNQATASTTVICPHDQGKK